MFSMKTPSFVTLPGPLQHYTIHTKEATRAALSEARQQLTKKGKDAILRRHGLHDMEPGSFMDGPGAILLLDKPYRLTTPDLLHLLLRIIKNVYDCTEISVKWGQKRGQTSKWTTAGDRISSQWKIRPNDGRNVATFPNVRFSYLSSCRTKHVPLLSVAFGTRYLYSCS